jgi:hypothetical protein
MINQGKFSAPLGFVFRKPLAGGGGYRPVRGAGSQCVLMVLIAAARLYSVY